MLYYDVMLRQMFDFETFSCT